MSDDDVVRLDDDPADVELLAALRGAVAESDPVPEAVLAAARGSLAWREVDAELAELLADTAAEPVGAGARSVTLDARLLTFRTPALTVELEVSENGTSRLLVGQVVPPVASDLRVRAGGEVLRVACDDLGRFSCEVPAGPLSLVVRAAGQRPVVTPWTAV